jgi:predicted MFS family arabinose efflux permease
LVQAAAFALLGSSPSFGSSSKLVLYLSAMLISAGSGIANPSLSAYASRRAGREAQGLTLGTLQSAAALARATGPALGGLLYASIAPSAPYYAGAVGFVVAAALAFARLR